MSNGNDTGFAEMLAQAWNHPDANAWPTPPSSRNAHASRTGPLHPTKADPRNEEGES